MDEKSKVNGLLLAAFKSKKIVKPTWVDIKVGDMTVTVATDALKAPALDQDAVRLGVNYKDTIEICRGSDWVVPTVPIFEAMFKQAKFPLPATTCPPTKDMDSVGWSIQFNDKIEGQLKGKNKPGDLVFGGWKLWILDVGLGKSKFGKAAACNHGFWDPAAKKWIQYLGFQHNDAHADYSQVLQPVQRKAKAKDGSEVDLLEVFAGKPSNVPAAFLDVYKS